MNSKEPTETVGGEIDVAAISKGDGFLWGQRKNLLALGSRQFRVMLA